MIEEICAEIERQMKLTESSVTIGVLSDILKFIKSLRKEPIRQYVSPEDSTLGKLLKEMKDFSPEEDLGISNEEYNDVVNGLIFGKEKPVSEDLEKELEQYFVNNHMQVGEDNRVMWAGSFCPNLIADFRNIARHFADWQKKIDANLGSNDYERGYCDERAFEAKRYQNGITQEDYNLAKAAAYEAGKQVKARQMITKACEFLEHFCSETCNLSSSYTCEVIKDFKKSVEE